MLSQPEPACLVIADISGYTELPRRRRARPRPGHPGRPHRTPSSARLRPTFRLAKLEGDAAFVYAARRDRRRLGAPGHDRAPLLRVPAPAARHRPGLELRVQRLHPVPNLDLKVVAHHGQIVRQRFAGREELVGSPTSSSSTACSRTTSSRRPASAAYALYTAACVAAMGLDDPAAAGPRRARRGVRGRRRDHGLGPRPRARRGRTSWTGPASWSSRRTRRGPYDGDLRRAAGASSGTT